MPTKKIVLASMGDMLGFPKSLLVNYVVRKKKRCPAFELPGAVRFNDALAEGRGKPFKPAQGRPPTGSAAPQYTGGTTGVSKGAVPPHRNLVANILRPRPGTSRR